jgi:hypothetical protein
VIQIPSNLNFGSNQIQIQTNGNGNLTSLNSMSMQDQLNGLSNGNVVFMVGYKEISSNKFAI